MSEKVTTLEAQKHSSTLVRMWNNRWDPETNVEKRTTPLSRREKVAVSLLGASLVAVTGVVGQMISEDSGVSPANFIETVWDKTTDIFENSDEPTKVTGALVGGYAIIGSVICRTDESCDSDR
jgi:hypothetical protein